MPAGSPFNYPGPRAGAARYSRGGGECWTPAGVSAGAGARGQVAELRRELTAASELVTQLAEQNRRLVEAVAILRVRTRVLMVFAAIMAAGLIALAVAFAAT